MTKYVAYRNINGEMYFLDEINKNGKTVLIHQSEIKHFDILKLRWNTAKEGRLALNNTNYKVVSTVQAEKLVNNK